MKKGLQMFNKEYLERCKGATPDQILEFIENYKNLVLQVPEKCQLMSMKVEPSLLKAFKYKAQLEGMPYQTLIKRLMREWLKDPSRFD